MARTPEQAAIIASEFISHSQATPVQRVKRAAVAKTLSQPVEWIYTQYQIDETTPAVYAFNAADEGGFVLVSAEDNARAVLGYSDEGSLDAEQMPANMRAWLQMYADELAQRFGIDGRGELKEGYYADLVIFDPETIAETKTFAAPHSYPTGIDYVVVNGQIVIDHGEHTNVLPGEILRKKRA